jgi:glycerol kinase
MDNTTADIKDITIDYWQKTTLTNGQEILTGFNKNITGAIKTIIVNPKQLEYDFDWIKERFGGHNKA